MGKLHLDNATIMKDTAKKVRKIYNNNVIIGFAGSVADAFNFSRNIRRKIRAI